MSGANMMQLESYTVLRHIEVHGPRSRPEVAAGLARQVPDVTKTLNNLVMLGYLARDETTKPINFALTNKARVKLSSPYVPKAAAPKARKPRTQRDPRVMLRVPASVTAKTRATSWTPPRRDGGAMATPYSAAEYQPSTRPGAMVAFALPSRMGDTLHYRDGRVTDMAGNPALK